MKTRLCWQNHDFPNSNYSVSSKLYGNNITKTVLCIKFHVFAYITHLLTVQKV